MSTLSLSLEQARVFFLINLLHGYRAFLDHCLIGFSKVIRPIEQEFWNYINIKLEIFFNPHCSFLNFFFNLFIEHCIPSNTSISKPEIKSSPIRLMTMFECWTARLMLSSSASSKGQKRTWPRSPTTCKVVVGVIGAHLRLW